MAHQRVTAPPVSSSKATGIDLKDPKALVALGIALLLGGGTTYGGSAAGLFGSGDMSKVLTELAVMNTKLETIQAAQRENKAEVVAKVDGLTAYIADLLRDANKIHGDHEKRLTTIEARQPQRR